MTLPPANHLILKIACVCLLMPSVFTACTSTEPRRSDTLANHASKPVELVKSQHNFDLFQYHGLEVSNPFGDLHVRKGTTNSAQLVLFVQRKTGSEAQVMVDRYSRNNLLELEINLASGSASGDVLRIDAVLSVPDQPSLKLTTTFGTIDAKKLYNPTLESFSESGDILLSATSLMHVHTEHGTIRATIMRPGWSGENHFSSGSGKVQAFFPLGPNLFLQVKAATEILSEFKLEITKKNGSSHAEFMAGDGTDKIVIESRKGGVELYSLVFDPRVYGPPSIMERQILNPDGL